LTLGRFCATVSELANSDEGNAMTVDEYCDKVWSEIRQLVLDEGPVAEGVDREMDTLSMPAELREAVVANLIALRCAEICSRAPGRYQGQHPAEILSDWVVVSLAASRGQ